MNCPVLVPRYYFALLFVLCIQQIDGVPPLAVITELARLNSVSISDHAQQFHRELLRNQDALHSTDLAISDAHIRKRICEDILSNGYLYALNLIPVDSTDIYLHRDDPEYSDVFRRLFSPSARSQNSYEYTNLYRQEEFQLQPSGSVVKEYVFVCPIKHSMIQQDIKFYYVSKEYNLGPRSASYKPVRFIFGNFMPLHQNTYGFNYVMLAEQPATIFTSPGFNVESYYLKIRKNIEPAESDLHDPLCRLILDKYNQCNRICMAVCTSSNFRYAHQVCLPCTEEEVSFRRADRVDLADGKSYHERMTICYCDHIHISVKSLELYISRAYRSNELFVYSRDPSNEKLYLENLSANLNIIDEINSLDFAEDRR